MSSDQPITDVPVDEQEQSIENEAVTIAMSDDGTTALVTIPGEQPPVFNSADHDRLCNELLGHVKPITEFDVDIVNSLTDEEARTYFDRFMAALGVTDAKDLDDDIRSFIEHVKAMPSHRAVMALVQEKSHEFIKLAQNVQRQFNSDVVINGLAYDRFQQQANHSIETLSIIRNALLPIASTLGLDGVGVAQTLSQRDCLLIIRHAWAHLETMREYRAAGDRKLAEYRAAVEQAHRVRVEAIEEAQGRIASLREQIASMSVVPDDMPKIVFIDDGHGNRLCYSFPHSGQYNPLGLYWSDKSYKAAIKFKTDKQARTFIVSMAKTIADSPFYLGDKEDVDIAGVNLSSITLARLGIVY